MTRHLFFGVLLFSFTALAAGGFGSGEVEPPQKMVGLTTAQLPSTCVDGTSVFDKTVSAVKYCTGNTWALATVGGVPLVQTSTLTLYVDNALGSDTNACTASGASACKTMQAAINKVPVFSTVTTSPQCTINVAAQSVAAETWTIGSRFALRGTSTVQSILIQGATETVSAGPLTVDSVTNTDPDTGTAVGNRVVTVTPDPSWTTDQWKGYFVKGLTGTGAAFIAVIAGNTSAALEFVSGTNDKFAAADTLQIQTPSTIWTGASAMTLIGPAVRLAMNDVTMTTTGLPVVTGSGVVSTVATVFTRVRFNTTGTSSNWTMGGASMSNCYFNGQSTSQLVMNAVTNNSVQNSLIEGYDSIATTQSGTFNLNTSELLNMIGATAALDFRGGVFTGSPIKVKNCGPVKFSLGGSMGLTSLGAAGAGLAMVSGSNTSTHILVDRAGQVLTSMITLKGGTTGFLLEGHGTLTQTGNIVFQAVPNPIKLDSAAVWYGNNASATITGTGNNTAVGVSVKSGARFFFTTAQPNITSTTSLYSLDGTSYTSSSPPIASIATGSSILDTTSTTSTAVLNGVTLVSERDFTAYNAANLGSGTAFAQTISTNASTLTADSSIVSSIIGIGGGNLVAKLCSDVVTCAAGNVYLTCTVACTVTPGTVTACAVTKSAVPAATTLTWGIATSCATLDPAIDVTAHFTTP